MISDKTQAQEPTEQASEQTDGSSDLYRCCACGVTGLRERLEQHDCGEKQGDEVAIVPVRDDVTDEVCGGAGR